jgi:pimeloyl-ACP methyl ester carboxylesterase
MVLSEISVIAERFAGSGVTIAADVAGPVDGTPVILQHGGGQTRASWGAAVEEGARRGFRMIALDLRGHGESDWSPTGDYSLDAYASDLGAVAATLAQPPFVVGASLGGLAGLVYMGEGGPGQGLVLVDVAPQLETVGTDRIRDFMQARPEGFADVEEAADAVAAYLPHRPRPRDTSGLSRNLRLRPDGRYRWHWDPAMFSGARQHSAERLEAAARGLTVPALLVRGRLSDVVSPEGAQAFLKLAPNAELADIAGADHMVAGDRNDAFNDAVFSFLERRKA